MVWEQTEAISDRVLVVGEAGACGEDKGSSGGGRWLVGGQGQGNRGKLSVTTVLGGGGAGGGGAGGGGKAFICKSLRQLD